MTSELFDDDIHMAIDATEPSSADDLIAFAEAHYETDAPLVHEIASPALLVGTEAGVWHDPGDPGDVDLEPLFSGSSDWNVGINEDTGNTVSKWPGGRYFDDLTWDEVEET